jgi:hypothetical protein
MMCAAMSCTETITPLPPPPPPPPPPSGPPNLAKGLVGNWSATYKHGPLQVVIGLNNNVLGINYVATLVTGNAEMHPGTVVWRGTWDRSVPNLVRAKQLCGVAGSLSATTVDVVMTVTDPNHFTEILAVRGSCKGYPVNWTRLPSP